MFPQKLEGNIVPYCVGAALCFFFFSGGARPDWLSILCIHSYQVSCNRVKSYSGLALDC